MKESKYFLGIPLSIALLTDIHNNSYVNIIKDLNMNNPDIICIAGDVIHGYQNIDDGLITSTQENVLPLLIECSKIAPTFMSLGNHEWMLTHEDTEQIRSTGVYLLDNEWTEYKGIYIGGQTSAYVKWYREIRKKLNEEDKSHELYIDPKLLKDGKNYIPPKKSLPDTSWLTGFASVSGYKILLCHHPEYYSFIPDEINLVLSGHAHGGQVRLFNHGLYAPGQGWFPKYTSGVYDNKLVVSKGLSNTAEVPRIFNSTEIVYIY